MCVSSINCIKKSPTCNILNSRTIGWHKVIIETLQETGLLQIDWDEYEFPCRCKNDIRWWSLSPLEGEPVFNLPFLFSQAYHIYFANFHIFHFKEKYRITLKRQPLPRSTRSKWEISAWTEVRWLFEKLDGSVNWFAKMNHSL
jgi:hypothetical protein